MDKKEKYSEGQGLTIGMCLGVAFGIIFDNLALGISIGMLSGLAYDNMKAKKTDKKESNKDDRK